MKPVDRDAYVKRYTERLREHSYSPEALGWGKSGRQDVRFSVLCEEVLRAPRSSVLDVGCGFADLYGFLRTRGWEGRYKGLDLVPGLLDVARERHPGVDVELLDIAEADPPEAPTFDYVVASGVFNAALEGEANTEHIERSLARMFGFARVAVCVDFLSAFADFQHPIAWHTDPGWAVATARRLSPRLRLRHDYMPFEFSLFVYRDDGLSDRGVFERFEPVI